MYGLALQQILHGTYRLEYLTIDVSSITFLSLTIGCHKGNPTLGLPLLFQRRASDV